MATQFGIYGNTVIKRAYCNRCKTTAFVLDGKLACCDKGLDEEATSQKQMVPAAFRRRKPPKKFQDEQLQRQNGRCFYCDEAFGNLYERAGAIKQVSIAWDHFVPFAYCGTNPELNFVAACSVCNGIKSSKVFNTVQEAKDYVEYRRKKKGIIYLSRMQEQVCEAA